VERVAILGSTGMIGSGLTLGLVDSNFVITEFNRAGESVFGANTSHKFDILKLREDRDFEIFLGFNYIINVAGIIRHKISKNSQPDIENAIQVNSLFPQRLGRWASRNGAKILQIGTDCVFSGLKGDYYEGEQFDPIDVYGFTKALGESSLLSTMTLRVSVVGRERSSSTELLDWILHQKADAKVEGYCNHIWNGVTPLHLSRVLSAVIQGNFFIEGVQHLVPGNKITKYDLIKKTAEIFGRNDLRIEKVYTARGVDRSLSSQSLTRNQEIWSGAGYVSPPSIEVMLEEYKDWINQRMESTRAENG
jgi:dTDP-4-dehydrorhamnose reductase